MNNFTEEEIKVAKQVKDALVNGDLAEELKSVYIAGEIVMWDELRNQSPSGADFSVLVEQLRAKNPFNLNTQGSRDRGEGYEEACLMLYSLAQYNAVEPEKDALVWYEGKTLKLDWTVLFSKSYDFQGLELMAQETKTEIGRVVIWPDRLSGNKKWSFYFEYDGWLKQDFNSEEEVKKAVAEAVKKELANQSQSPQTPIDTEPEGIDGMGVDPL